MGAETGCESMNGGMGWSWRADETVKEEEVRDRMEVDGERKLGAGHSGHPVQ